MLEKLNSDSKLVEVPKKVIPALGDFIMYQGNLVKVVKIKHFKQCMIVESDSKQIDLPLKVGYRIFTAVA
jgi:hypothetical protein